MASKVTCTCGWSWNKSDSSKKDMYVCHNCGKDNTMKDGGWLSKYNIPKAQKGKVAKYNPLDGEYVLDADGAIQTLSNVGEVFSAPQKTIVKGITGKYQTPSEAMDIKNPYGAFAVDAVLDPLNLLGVGIAGKAAKASTKSGILSEAYKLNPYAFKPNESNWYRQVGDSAIDDAFNTGLIREAGEEVSPRMLQEFEEQLVRMQGHDMEAALASRRPTSPFFAKGELFYPMGRKPSINKVTGKVSKNPAGKGSADYLIETNLPNESFQPAYVKGMGVGVPTEIGQTAILKPNPSLRDLKNFNIYKQHWLKGYKQISKKENGGWLSKYNTTEAQNGIEGTMAGLTDQGFNYNGAWGGTMQTGGNLPQAQDGMLDRIYSKWPALKKLGNVTIKSDESFTKDKTGVGDIEFFSPNLPQVNYDNGYIEPHPGPGTYGVVYNPLTNNDQNIRLDMLHGMSGADNQYKRLRNSFERSVKHSDINDAMKHWYNVDKEKGSTKDGKKQWIDNYVDGQLRTLLFEGDRASQNYSDEEANELLANPKIKTKFDKLNTYLKKGEFGSSLPGSVGFTYARTQDPAPSNGPYAKKTKASAQDGIQTFYNNYLQSPKYKERLMKEGFSNPNSVINQRLKNVSKSKIKSGSESYYDPTTFTAFINQKDAKTYNTPISSVIAHELSHAAGALGRTDDFNPGNLGLSNFAINQINKRNNLSGYVNDYIQGKAPLNIEKMHDSKPSEFKADMDMLRYRLFNDKIYDAGKQDFNQDVLNKAKQKYKGDKEVERLFKRAKDQDLIWLMNNIAQVNSTSDDQLPMAQNGQEMKYYQEGLDWKPKNISQNGTVVPNWATDINTRLLNAVSTFGGSAIGDAVKGVSPRAADWLNENSMGFIPYTTDEQLMATRAGNPDRGVNTAVQASDAVTNLLLNKMIGPLAGKANTAIKKGTNKVVKGATNFAQDFSKGYKAASKPSQISSSIETSLVAPKGNMYGDNQVLTQQQRLLDPKIKAKFFENQSPSRGPKTNMLEKVPADLDNRITPENYDNFVKNIHSSTDYNIAATTGHQPQNLGIGSYGKPGMVYSDAPLTSLGKDIINAHEKNHGIFAGTLSTKMSGDLLKPFGTKRAIPHYSDKHQADEVLARMGQFKNAVGIGDNQTFTLGHLNLVRKNYTKNFLDNSITEMLAKVKPGSKGEKEFIKNMNKYAFGAAPATFVGAEALQQKKEDGGWLSKYQEGGIIEDDRGQWEYPGEITKINSNQITMQGVDYPVLGISDTGDTQMMQPGQDYTYDGKSVTEYPMMQDGGLMSYREPILNAKDRFVQKQMNKFGDAKFVNRALEIAEKQGYDYGADDGGPLDAVRHAAMSASVAKNLKVPKVIGKYAPALDDAIRMGAANLMGFGYELSNFNEGEGFLMDMKNNYIGSDIGVMKNLTDEERAKKIAGMLKYNKLSIDNTKKPKKENGGWLSKYN